MPTISQKRANLPTSRTMVGFEEFCEAIDFELQPFMRRIARAYFDPAKETVAILPRGCYKTSTAAVLGLHHLMSVKGASVVIGASSRDQARICFERMESFLAHPALDGVITQRHLELRFKGDEGIRRLRVIPSDGPRTHGLSCSLYIADELWAWSPRADLLTAMQTGLIKRADAKLLVISTASGDLDSPLGRLRQRAMAIPNTKRSGPVVEAKDRDMHWIEWSLADHHELDNLEAVLRCNPAKSIRYADIRRQRDSLSEGAFAQFHCCRWGIRESTWLPEGAWAACQGEVEFKPGERVWCGIDIGGSRSASALVWLNERYHVGSVIGEGDDAVFEIAHETMKLAEKFSIQSINFDPWRAAVIVKQFENRGIESVTFPWTDSRVIPGASELYDAITESKLVHNGDETLAKHMATVVGKATRRGLRIDKAAEDHQIDAACALLMAYEARTAPEPPPTTIEFV